MILMGSQASRLRGDLPSWSDPGSTDWDIVGSRAEFEALRQHLNGEGVIAHDRGAGRLAIRVPLDDEGGRILIDWVTDEIESSRLLAALPDHGLGDAFGLSCQVVSPLTEYVMKRVLADFPGPEKTSRWLQHWRVMLGSNPALTAEHEAFETQLRAEYESRFSQAV